MVRIIFLSILGFILACAPPAQVSERTPPTRSEPVRPAAPSAETEGFSTLVSWMTGSFSSHVQAIQDSNYFDIHLEMWPIWQDTPGEGAWLYVEQAVAGSESKPYRQRIYRITPGKGDTLVSSIYLLPEPDSWVGAWPEPERFDDLEPAQLTLRDGCEIPLVFQAGAFRGATGDGSCSSDLHGASYASSEVVIRETVLESWDRGFDAAGNQVWGAEQGPYVFRKNTPR